MKAGDVATCEDRTEEVTSKILSPKAFNLELKELESPDPCPGLQPLRRITVPRFYLITAQ